MNTGVVAVALLAFSAALAAPVPREVKPTLSGTWDQVSLEVPPELGKVPDDLVWTFEKEKVTARRRAEPGKVFAEYAFEADSNKNPSQLSLTLDHGKRKWVQHGIYKLERDRLTICFGVAAGDEAVNESTRPTEFKAGPDTSLVVLKRREK